MYYLGVNDQGRMQRMETDEPVIGEQDALISVSAFGLNRADLLQKAGQYPAPEGESPILGLEVSGVIEALGSGTNGWQVGDRVSALVPGGGYAQKVRVPAGHMLSLPEDISFTEGAGIMETFLTAYQALVWLGQLKHEQRVLIHAGASGVGSAAIQLAKSRGARVAVTASTHDKLSYCRDLGAEITINYRQQDFVEVIKDTMSGVDLVVDVVAGDYVNRNLKVLNQDGRIVTLAILGGRFAEKLDVARLLQKRATLMGSTLRNRDNDYKTALVRAFGEDCRSLLAQRKLSANVQQVFGVDEVEQAHDIMAANNSRGKLVIRW